MSKGPRRPKEPKEDDFEQQEAKIAKVVATIAQLKDEKVMLQEQFERLVQRTSHLQNEINSRLKEQSALMKDDGPKPEQKEEVAMHKKDRQQQEDMVKDELMKMLQERMREGVAPKRDNEYTAVEVASSSMQYHTIRIRYMISETSTRGDNAYEVYEATYRIGKNTTFKRLIEEARTLWVPCTQSIPHLEIKHLRTSAMQSLDFPADQTIEKMILDSGINPDLWIIGVGKGLGLEPQRVQITVNNLTENTKEKKNSKKVKMSGKMAMGDADTLLNAMMPYKGLKTMLPPRTTSTKIAIGAKHKDTHCCTITFLVLLLILTAYIYAGRAFLRSAYDIHHGVLNSLDKDFEPRKSFSEIRTYSDVVQFLYYVLPTALYRSEDNSYAKLLDSFILVGGLMIRVQNTKQKECNHAHEIPTTRVCYYETYDSSTRSTEFLSDQIYNVTGMKQDWRTWRSSAENNIDFDFIGEFGTYDGSGYSIVFPYSNMTKSEYQSMAKYLLYNGFLSSNTRTIFTSFTLYSPSLAVWAETNLLLEFSPSHAIFPSNIITKVFRPNIFMSQEDKNLQTADIFRIIFAFYIFYLFVFEVVVGKDNKPNIQHIFSFQGLMDLLMMASIFAAFGISYSLNADTTSLIEKNEFRGMGRYSSQYFSMLQFNIIALVLIILRIVMFMRIVPAINIILLTMQTAVPGFMTFVAVFGPLLVGISLLSMSIWGPYMYEYHTIQAAIATNLLFYTGSGDNISMTLINPSWGIVFFTVFFFMFLFFLVCEAISTFVEAYVNVRLSLGYEGRLREKNEDDEPIPINKKVFVRWLLEFLPVKWKVALFERENRFGFDKILS